MIIHLITDDKFADYAIEQFTSVDASSVFVLMKSSENEQIVNIKSIDKVQQIVENSNEYDYFIKNITVDDAVITHGLFYPWQEKIVSLIPNEVKVAWVCWGGEIYGRKKLLLSFLGHKTKVLYWQKQLKRLIKSKKLLGDGYFASMTSFRRINYCLSDMYEEFEFVNNYTKSNMKYLWYNYYSIEETLGDLQDSKVNGINIIIGNSCTLENNHLDAFKLLKHFDIEDKQIIVPLSYGSDWLKRIILNRGMRLFKNNFRPLLTFMNRDEYNKTLCSCSIFIMPHYRPQAQGNIITGLWLGAKVYLSNKSITYNYFKQKGFYVFSIEDDLKSNNKFVLNGLNENQIIHNRNILMEVYGKENVMLNVKKIIEELNSIA